MEGNTRPLRLRLLALRPVWLSCLLLLVPPTNVVLADTSVVSATTATALETDSTDVRSVLRRGHFCRSLDPRTTSVNECAHLMLDVYEGLLRVAPDGSLAPGVAREWVISPESESITFHLNRDRRWSDGEPVVAEDFISAWRSVLAAKSWRSVALNSLLQIEGAKAFQEGRAETVSGLTAPDPHTLVVRFDKLDLVFAERTVRGAMLPIPAHFFAQHAEQWHQQPDAPFNGVYQIANRADTTARDYDLILNPYHPDAKTAHFQRVHYVYLNEEDYSGKTELRRLVGQRRSESQAAQGVSDIVITNRSPKRQVLQRLEKSGWRSTQYESSTSYFLLLNQSALGPELTQALKLILNANEYASRANENGKATVRLVNMQSGTPFSALSNPFDLPRAQRFAKARALLKPLKLSRDAPKVLSIKVLSQRRNLLNTVALNALLRPFALQVSVEEVAQVKDYVGQLKQGFGDLIFVSLFAPFNDPSVFFLPVISAQDSVFSADDQTRFQALLQRSRTANHALRHEALAAAEQLTIERGGFIPLIQPRNLLLVRKELCNVNPSVGRKVLSAWVKPCA